MKALAFVKKYWLLIIVLAVFALLITGYIAGYRLGTGGMPVKVGTLVIEGMPEGSTVFVDQTRKHVATAQGKTSILLLPGTHAVIVDSGTKYPWNELVSITPGAETHVRPVLITMRSVYAPVPAERRQEANTALYARTLPTKANPLSLANGCALVYTSGNRIVAEATISKECDVPEYLICTEESRKEFGVCLPTIIFEAGDALKSVIPYPGRSDVIIVASQNMVYVLELDPREPRFFAPLVKGADIRTAPWSETSIITSSNTGPQEISL